MRPRVKLLVWLVVSVFAFSSSSTALATSPCQPPRPAEAFDRVVYAHLVVKPAPWIALLWVHKYYKGSGPRFLVVEYDGRWALDSWSGDQSARNYHLALTPTLLGNRILPCTLVDHTTFGSGVTPYPGINPITPWALVYESVAGYLLYRWYRRRRELRMYDSYAGPKGKP
jgi:hypothetical protein